jgi:hypothetical protein
MRAVTARAPRRRTGRTPTVDSPQDPRVADFVGLTDGARRMLHEPGAGFFIAEGEKVDRAHGRRRLPARGSLLVSPSRLADLSPGSRRWTARSRRVVRRCSRP